MAVFAAALAFSFLVGSVPFGMVFSRLRGVDPRASGSGNIGATNVLRTAGKSAAALTLLGDAMKGVAAVALGKALGMGPASQGALGLAAIAGHDFSIFLKFRGGKGVATSIGVMLIYMPMVGLLTVSIWVATVVLSRRSSLGALVSFCTMPALAYLSDAPPNALYISVIISLLLVARHTENIKRLIKGAEGKIGEKA